MALHIETEKLAGVVQDLLKDVNGIWASSNAVVGEVDGCLIRIEALSVGEANTLNLDPPAEAYNCIWEK